MYFGCCLKLFNILYLLLATVTSIPYGSKTTGRLLKENKVYALFLKKSLDTIKYSGYKSAPWR